MQSSWIMSPDMSVSHLLALSPRGKEVIEVARNLAELTSMTRLPSLIRDTLEMNNVEASDGSDVNNDLAYYSNPLHGEVYQVDFSGGGLSVEKLAERYEFTCLQNDFFARLRTKIEQDQINWVHLFELPMADENTTPVQSTCLLVTGISEYMECNFWSIHSSCVWTVQPHGDNEVLLSGKLSLSGHYFEDCNFHFSGDEIEIKPVRVPFDEIFNKMTRFLARIRTSISNKFLFHEVDFGDQLVATNPAGTAVSGSGRCSAVLGPVQVSSVVRKLRRTLPVHKTKFDWNINKVQLIQNLS